MKYHYLSAIFVLSMMLGCSNAPGKAEKKADTNDPDTAVVSSNNEPPPAEITYDTYCNSRYGYCIDYPAGILYPQGEAPSGDGQVFKSRDAENELLVYRDLRDNFTMDEPYTITTAYEEDARGNDPEKPKRVIVYKKLGKDYFIVSGYDNGKIFYQKTILREEGLVTALLLYRESDKSFYDAVSERIFKSLK